VFLPEFEKGRVGFSKRAGASEESNKKGSKMGHFSSHCIFIENLFFQDGIIIENMHDIPYLHTESVGPEIVSTMTAACSQVRRLCPELPLGVQILAGANKQALAVALAAGEYSEVLATQFLSLLFLILL
jgi:hypothetical protein